MQKQEPISNQTQIFRHDARGCFVEAKCDRFHLDRVHLQFVAYDKNRPQGQRYTNNVNIYIPIPEFLVLYQEAASGVLHGRMQQYKTTGQQESLYEHMGGTPASTLARLGKARPDGKSVSRVTKLVAGSRSDYLFVARAIRTSRALSSRALERTRNSMSLSASVGKSSMSFCSPSTPTTWPGSLPGTMQNGPSSCV